MTNERVSSSLRRSCCLFVLRWRGKALGNVAKNKTKKQQQQQQQQQQQKRVLLLFLLLLPQIRIRIGPTAN